MISFLLRAACFLIYCANIMISCVVLCCAAAGLNRQIIELIELIQESLGPQSVVHVWSTNRSAQPREESW